MAVDWSGTAPGVASSVASITQAIAAIQNMKFQRLLQLASEQREDRLRQEDRAYNAGLLADERRWREKETNEGRQFQLGAALAESGRYKPNDELGEYNDLFQGISDRAAADEARGYWTQDQQMQMAREQLDLDRKRTESALANDAFQRDQWKEGKPLRDAQLQEALNSIKREQAIKEVNALIANQSAIPGFENVLADENAAPLWAKALAGLDNLFNPQQEEGGSGAGPYGTTADEMYETISPYKRDEMLRKKRDTMLQGRVDSMRSQIASMLAPYGIVPGDEYSAMIRDAYLNKYPQHRNMLSSMYIGR